MAIQSLRVATALPARLGQKARRARAALKVVTRAGSGALHTARTRPRSF